MPSFKKESSLLLPVRKSLSRRGYRCQKDEVQFYEYSIDLYGYASSYGKTTAVELKLHKWRRAFEQALIYQLCADFSYIALPIESTARVDIGLLTGHGLGLIGVHADKRCRILLQAKQSAVVKKSYRDFYIRFVQGIAS